MRKKTIEPGTRFGALVVIRAAGQDPTTRKSLSECRCACGAVVVKRNNDLLTGRVVSCGCVKRRRSSRQMWKRAERSNANHMSGTKVYYCWKSMVDRCTNTHNKRFERYGGRGISVCRSWLKSFRRFRTWAYAHGYEDGLQIDRVDYDGDYRPGNCRFVDRTTQANNRSNNRFIEYEGRRMTVAQWSRELNIPYDRLKRSTRKGESIDGLVRQD